ncbi:MAG: hypothetical protein ACTSPN_10440 [Promethearchaeota archaeon]
MSTLDRAYKEIEGIIGSKYITEKDFMKAAYSRNVDKLLINSKFQWYPEEVEPILLVARSPKEEFSWISLE